MNTEKITVDADVLKQAIADTVSETVDKKVSEKLQTIQFDKDSNKIPDIFAETIKVKSKPANKLGTVIRMLGYAKLNNMNISEAFKDNNLEIRNFLDEQHEKIASASVGSAGGYLIPEFYIDEIIPALRNNSVLRKAGAKVYDLPNGNGLFTKIATGISAYWKGENEAKTVSNQVFGQIALNVKTLAVDVPVSNKLIRYSNGNNDVAIVDDIQAGLITGEDLAFIEGTGSAYQPKGLLNWINTANKNNMTATPDSAKIKIDLLKAKKMLAIANIPLSNPVWIMPEACKVELESRVDANSNPMDYARQLQETGKIYGYPVFSTNAIAGTSSYNVYLIDIAQCIIGEGQSLTIEFVPNGDYWDGSKTVSGRSTDTSVYTAMLDVDFALKYDKAGAVIQSVTWGL